MSLALIFVHYKPPYPHSTFSSKNFCTCYQKLIVIVTNFKYFSRWPFRWGNSLLFGATALSALYFNTRYRRKLKLISLGDKSSYLAVTAVPTTISMLTHTQVYMPLFYDFESYIFWKFLNIE